MITEDRKNMEKQSTTYIASIPHRTRKSQKFHQKQQAPIAEKEKQKCSCSVYSGAVKVLQLGYLGGPAHCLIACVLAPHSLLDR